MSTRVLNLVPFRPILGNDELRVGEKEKLISYGILKYIGFWKLGMSKDNSYSKVMGPYVKYWASTLELLLRPIPQHSYVLLECFWPSSNWRINYEHACIHIVVDVDHEDHVIPPYCGPRSMCPSLSIATYTHFCDLFVSKKFLLRPSNLIIYHV